MPQPRSLPRSASVERRNATTVEISAGTKRSSRAENSQTLARAQELHVFLHSNSLRARGRAVIPGGTSERSAGDRGYPLLSPAYIRSGKGCRVVDADGHSYIEYGAGTCPVILGHAHPAVVSAVEASLRSGDAFTRGPVIEAEAAEALIDLFPEAEMARFFSSEAEALAAAAVLARSVTGRSMIVRIQALDETVGPAAGEFPPHACDLSAVQDLFSDHGSSIAALVIDAAGDEELAQGLLNDLVEIARRHGALAVLDECTTGLRWAPGGAQQAYGCKPDLSIIGRGAANGLPFSALVGTRPLMRLLTQFDGLTHNGFPLLSPQGAAAHCLAAALAVIRVHRAAGVADALHETGRRLRDGVRERIQRHGVGPQITVSGRACRPVLRARDTEGYASEDLRALLLQEMIRRGVLMPTLAPSLAHDESAVTATLDAIDAALGICALALSNGVERYLVGRPGGGRRAH